MPYLSWKETTIDSNIDARTPAGASTIEKLYNEGFVFTRIKKGVLQQTRSARIDLTKFELTSENRRIQKKTGLLSLSKEILPYTNYSWEIGKMAKDFYEARGAEFSANKVKELLTDTSKSNFNVLLTYSKGADRTGYCIAAETASIIHYSYPFYGGDSKDLGLSMMIEAILSAQDSGKKYIYLGSLQRPSDTYKLQFKGFEWFDGTEWKTSLEEAKEALKPIAE